METSSAPDLQGVAWLELLAWVACEVLNFQPSPQYGVSKNGVTPKWMGFSGKIPLKWMIYGNLHMVISGLM